MSGLLAAAGIGVLVTASPTPQPVTDQGGDRRAVALPRGPMTDQPTPAPDADTTKATESADGRWADIAGDGPARVRSQDQRAHLPGALKPEGIGTGAADPTDAACTTPQGDRCAHPMLPGADAVAAVAVSKGAIVIERDGTLTRLRLSTQGHALRWQTTADVDADHGGAGSSAAPAWHLTRRGSALVVGSASGVAVHDIGDGTVRWRMEVDGGAGPWQAWAIDDAVLAVGEGHLAAFDLADGSPRWERSHPTDDAQPTEVGVALLSRDRITMFTPDGPDARWSVTVPPAPTSPAGLTRTDPGPVVSVGDHVRLHDVTDGSQLARFGEDATATRARSGVAVVAVWGDVAGRPTLLGLDADGSQRWSRAGPAVPCCDLLLRPLEDGRVVAAPRQRPGRTEVGEVLDPDDGRTLATLRRPGQVDALPRAVAGDTAVWQDGSMLLGGPTARGDIEWSTGPDSTVLLESPLLLATRDGVLAP